MSRWPTMDDDRERAMLLRADVAEGRYLAAREYHHAVDHLLCAAAAACLLDQEDDAVAFIARAAQRTEEWVAAGEKGLVKRTLYAEFAATRGLLALAFAPDARAAAVHATVRSFLAQTADAPPGPVQNARLAAACLAADSPALLAAANACALSDPGLGLPWKRFATALDAQDRALALRSATAWLRETLEATRTNEWGAYQDVPIEVSAALALAERRGMALRIPSDRVLLRFRAA